MRTSLCAVVWFDHEFKVRCLIEHLAHIVLLGCSTNKWCKRSTGTYTLLSGHITRGLQIGYRAFML